jgi:2,5-diketo-D-gluconate reductase B
MMETIDAPGMRMPKLGLGTWQMRGDDCRAAVERALALGYRHIDTAEGYGNEAEVGAALAGSGVARGDVHLTTKVSQSNLAPDAMRRALDSSLQKLRTEYVDLYLIHWPAPGQDMRAPLETLAALRDGGRVRAIGVSNFPVALMRLAVEGLGLPIACNQVEYHPLLDQSAVLAYARTHGIAVAAYCPIARGEVFNQPELEAVARKHGATAAQVALRWLMDQDHVAAIPKAAREETQRQNLAALDLRLDDDDRARIARAPKNRRLVNPGWAPAWDRAA